MANTKVEPPPLLEAEAHLCSLNILTQPLFDSFFDILSIMEELKELHLGSEVDRLRKPEARTEYASALLDGVKVYFGDTLHQEQPPELIEQFKKGKGVIFPMGSVLQGTARVGSDIDLILFYDSHELEEDKQLDEKKLEDIVEDSQTYHPAKVKFRHWLIQRFRNRPEYEQFVQVSRDFLKRQVESFNSVREKHYPESKPKTFVEEDVLKYHITAEGYVIDVGHLTDNIEKLVDPPETTLVSHLLTSDQDFAVESGKGDLLHHQRSIVQSIAKLENENPDAFAKVYESLANSFKRSILWKSENHPHATSFYQPFEAYVRKSGRFPEEKVPHAARLLQGVRKQTTFPPFQAFKEKYLGT